MIMISQPFMANFHRMNLTDFWKTHPYFGLAYAQEIEVSDEFPSNCL